MIKLEVDSARGQKLQVLDVTKGTQVSFSAGFQIADDGLWYASAGSLILAPEMAVNGPLVLSCNGNINDPVFK